MSQSWRRYDDPGEGADHILDAAGAMLATRGVGGATMVDVAQQAGCSRATLYRYFPTRDDLRPAYVNRAALRIAVDIREGRRRSSPAAELTRRIQVGLSGVRADSLLAVWFEPENLDTAPFRFIATEVIARRHRDLTESAERRWT